MRIPPLTEEGIPPRMPPRHPAGNVVPEVCLLHSTGHGADPPPVLSPQPGLWEEDMTARAGLRSRS